MSILLQEDVAGIMHVLLEDGSPSVLSVGTVSMLSTGTTSVLGNGTFKSISETLLGNSHVAAGGEALILVLDTHLNWQHCRESWGKVERDGRAFRSRA